MRRRGARLAPALLVAVLFTACGGEAPIADTDLRILVEPETLEVEPGKPFGLRVTRIWDRDLEPVPWDDAALSPLVTRLVSTSRREDARHHEEVFRYRAYAFSLEDVKIPSVLFAARPKAGGNPRIVTTPALRLRVKPALDPEAAGEPELFGTMRPEPVRWAPWAILLGVLALGGAVWRLRRGTPAEAEHADESPVTTPYGRASRELAAADVDVVGAAEILRVYVFGQLGVRTRERTTPEVLEAPTIDALPTDARASLGEVLSIADLAKFAAHEPTAAEAVRLVAQARAFVDVTGRAR